MASNVFVQGHGSQLQMLVKVMKKKRRKRRMLRKQKQRK